MGQGTFEKIRPIWEQLIQGNGMQLDVKELIAEGNHVAARYIESGTFRNPALDENLLGNPISWLPWNSSLSRMGKSRNGGVLAIPRPKRNNWALKRRCRS